MSTDDTTFITEAEIAVINAARTTLEAISNRAFKQNNSQASGMVFAKAESAADELFNLLNWSSSYGHQRSITDTQLHNSKNLTVAPEPQSLRA